MVILTLCQVSLWNITWNVIKKECQSTCTLWDILNPGYCLLLFIFFSIFAFQGTWPGQCQCREGYTGKKCDRCAFGYRGYPNCLRCNCSLIGSINEDPCTESCLCKVSIKLSFLLKIKSVDWFVTTFLIREITSLTGEITCFIVSNLV